MEIVYHRNKKLKKIEKIIEINMYKKPNITWKIRLLKMFKIPLIKHSHMKSVLRIIICKRVLDLKLMHILRIQVKLDAVMTENSYLLQ
jgi:hypothetical protein